MRFTASVDPDNLTTTLDLAGNCFSDSLPLVQRLVFRNAEFDPAGPEMALAAALLTRRHCGELFEMAGSRIPAGIAEAIRAMIPGLTSIASVDGHNRALASGDQPMISMEASQTRPHLDEPAINIDWSGDFVAAATRRSDSFQYGRYLTNAALLVDPVEVSIAIGVLHAGMRHTELHVPLPPGVAAAPYAGIAAALRLAGINLHLVAAPLAQHPVQPAPAAMAKIAPTRRRPAAPARPASAQPAPATVAPASNTIWLYWENHYSGCRPAYLELCLDSVRRHAGGAKVVVVEPETLSSHLDAASLPQRYASLSPNHKSDYLRMRLLRDHGGMWIDIDTIVFQSLSEHVLGRLQEAELVSPSGGLAQQLFASRPGGAFVSEAVAALESLLATDAELAWADLGSELVYPIAARHPHAEVLMKCWLHGWHDWRKYLEPGDADYDRRLSCMLYNKHLFEPLRELDRKQILGKDWLLSRMFRQALAL